MFQSEEDDDFNINKSVMSGSSRLSSLFGDNSTGSAEQPLTYTAPKQPRSKETITAAESSKPAAGKPSAVLQAAAVHCYKYINGQYENQGKVGAALLGNQTNAEFRILLYVTQQKPVANATITPAFKFEVLANQYARFYDDAKQLYSLRFDVQDELHKFAKQVVLCVVASGIDSMQSVAIQDLLVGEGNSIADGDSAELKYTGWIYSQGATHQMFDSNMEAEKAFRLKLGAGKVIKGWEQGIVGMKSGGKRFIIIPPHLAYGQAGVAQRIPPNSFLAFEVNLLRMKSAQQPEQVAPPIELPYSPPSLPGFDDDAQDEDVQQGVKSRTKSISEQLEHGGADKANLKNRMARLGNAMLPGLAVAPKAPQVTHTEQEPTPPRVDYQHDNSWQPEVVTDHMIRSQSVQRITGQGQGSANVYQAISSQQQQQQQQLSQNASPAPSFASAYYGSLNQPGYQQQAAMFSQNAQLDPYVQQQLLLQQQVQNAANSGLLQTPFLPQQPLFAVGSYGGHARLSQAGSAHDLSELDAKPISDKLNAKLDIIIDKVDKLNTSSAHVPNVETKTLLENITRIVKENDRLKVDVSEKTAKIEQQNEKISELLQQSQRHMEQNHQFLEQRNESFKSTATQSQGKILQLEQEKVALTNELSHVTSQLSLAQLEVTELKKAEHELKVQLASISHSANRDNEELSSLKAQLSDHERKASVLTQSVKQEKQQRRDVELKITQLEEELIELKDANATLNKAVSERRQKAQEERNVHEQELSELKVQHQEEINLLKERLQRRQTADSSEKIAQLEADIEAQWKSKLSSALNSERQESNKKLRELGEEKEKIQSQAVILKEKLLKLKEMYEEKMEELQTANAELEELDTYKQKFEAVKDYTRKMKETHQEQIQELEENITELQESVQNIKQKTKQLIEQLASRFEPTMIYSGTAIRDCVLSVVKGKPEAPVPIIENASDFVTQQERAPEAVETNGDRNGVIYEPQIRPAYAYTTGDNGSLGHVNEPPQPARATAAVDYKRMEVTAQRPQVEPSRAEGADDKGQKVTAQVTQAGPTHCVAAGDEGRALTAPETQMWPPHTETTSDKGRQVGARDPQMWPTDAETMGDKERDVTAPQSQKWPTHAETAGDERIKIAVREPEIWPTHAETTGDNDRESALPQTQKWPTHAETAGDEGRKIAVREPVIWPTHAETTGDNDRESAVPQTQKWPTLTEKVGDKAAAHEPLEPPTHCQTTNDNVREVTAGEPQIGLSQVTGEDGKEKTRQPHLPPSIVKESEADMQRSQLEEYGNSQSERSGVTPVIQPEQALNQRETPSPLTSPTGYDGSSVEDAVETAAKTDTLLVSTKEPLALHSENIAPKDSYGNGPASFGGSNSKSSFRSATDTRVSSECVPASPSSTNGDAVAPTGQASVELAVGPMRQSEIHTSNRVADRQEIRSKPTENPTKTSLFDSDSDEEDFILKSTNKSTTSVREKPPPLFGEEEDEDDLDWLS